MSDVIPFTYRLRPDVRVEGAAGGTFLVISGVPLSVLRINAAAARLLELARGGSTVEELAAGLSVSAERCLALCDALRRRGILELDGATPPPCAPPPRISVVVPTRDRPVELAECLASLARVDHPADKLEVIVVDDGSNDPQAIARVAADHGARLLVNETNRGPSHARNRAAREASGEILAFIDSDCVADPGWLRGLTPFFAWRRVAAVGGRTLAYHRESTLDRYEEASSSLDMGARLLFEANGSDSLYAPTCNLLVRRADFLQLGGLREGLRVGEDVDFCWRLREAGAVLVYAPQGTVRHKHPARLRQMLLRRAAYGSSEANLRATHPDKLGRFAPPPAPCTTLALTAAGMASRRSWLLAAALASPVWDAFRRSRRLHRAGAEVPAAQVLLSTLRGHLSGAYVVSFRVVRYHLWALLALAAVIPRVRLPAIATILSAALVDYTSRRPRLSFPVYLGYYVAEHAAYQTGVIAGHVARIRYRLGRSGKLNHSSTLTGAAS